MELWNTNMPVPKAMGMNEEIRRQYMISLIKAESPRVKLTKPHNHRSEAWVNFKLIEVDGVNQQFAICDHCSRVLSCRRGTGSMLRHNCLRNRVDAPPAAKPPDAASATGSPLYEPPDPAPPPPNQLAASLGNALTTFLITQLLPPDLVETDEFRQLAAVLTTVDYSTVAPLLWRNSVVNNFITPLYNSHRNSVDQTLHAITAKVNFVIHDVLSVSGSSILQVDVAYIDSNYKFVRRPVGYYSAHSKTAAELEGLIEQIKFDVLVNADPVSSYVVTDCDQAFRQAANFNFCSVTAIEKILQATDRLLEQGAVVHNGTNAGAVESHSMQTSIGRSTPLKQPQCAKQLHQLRDLLLDAKEALSETEQPTIHMVALWRHHLLECSKANDCLQADHSADCDVHKVITELIEHQFKTSILHDIALFLDPRFKNLKFFPEQRRLEVYQTVRNLMPSLGAHRNKAEPQATSLSPLPASIPFLNLMDESDIQENEMDELTEYLNMRVSPATDLMQFWQTNGKLGELASFAKAILSLPASARNTKKEQGGEWATRLQKVDFDLLPKYLFLHDVLSGHPKPPSNDSPEQSDQRSPVYATDYSDETPKDATSYDEMTRLIIKQELASPSADTNSYSQPDTADTQQSFEEPAKKCKFS